jgi:surfeit locus 1 family protein
VKWWPAVTPDGQWPYGGQTRMVLSNNHLQYAVTWYGLALVLVFISGLWHIRALKQRAPQD